MKKTIAFEQSSAMEVEFAKLRAMKEWLPAHKKEEFSVAIDRIEAELRHLSSDKLAEATGSTVEPNKSPTNTSPIAAIDTSMVYHSASIMIFESPAGKSEHPTADNCSPNEFYCNEQEEAQALKEQYRKTALMKEHFSPIIEVMNDGSTAKKPNVPQPQKLQPSRRKKYNYLEGVRPYLY